MEFNQDLALPPIDCDDEVEPSIGGQIAGMTGYERQGPHDVLLRAILQNGPSAEALQFMGYYAHRETLVKISEALAGEPSDVSYPPIVGFAGNKSFVMAIVVDEEGWHRDPPTVIRSALDLIRKAVDDERVTGATLTTETVASTADPAQYGHTDLEEMRAEYPDLVFEAITTTAVMMVDGVVRKYTISTPIKRVEGGGIEWGQQSLTMLDEDHTAEVVTETTEALVAYVTEHGS